MMMESKLSKQRSEDMGSDGNRTRTEASGSPRGQILGCGAIRMPERGICKVITGVLGLKFQR